MPAEYLDLSYVTWESMRDSIMPGWGLYVSATGPSPSGAIPSSYAARGRSLTDLVSDLGTQGRANGVRAEPQNDGYMLVTVGVPAWAEYNGVLVHPMNVRERSAASPGQSDWAVTADGEGVTSTVRDAGARFPGRQLITGDVSNTKYLAQQTLETAKRQPGTITLEANVDLSGIRPGDVVPYIRAAARHPGSMYLRILSISIDESSLPETFTLTGQVVEPSITAPTRLQQGIYWPGVRNTGSRTIRRIQGF